MRNVRQVACEKPVRWLVHRDSDGHFTPDRNHSGRSVDVTTASSGEGDEMVTMRVDERIDTAGDGGSRFRDAFVGAPIGDSDGARMQRSGRMTVSMLVLSTAGFLIALLTFVLGQWVDARSDETHLVDTADCRVIAVSSAASLEGPDCDESIYSPIVSGSAHVDGAVPSPTPSILGPSRVVAAPGLWIHSILQSAG